MSIAICFKLHRGWLVQEVLGHADDTGTRSPFVLKLRRCRQHDIRKAADFSVAYNAYVFVVQGGDTVLQELEKRQCLPWLPADGPCKPLDLCLNVRLPLFTSSDTSECPNMKVHMF